MEGEGEHTSIYRVVAARDVPCTAQARAYYSAPAVLSSFEFLDAEFRALYAAFERWIHTLADVQI